NVTLNASLGNIALNTSAGQVSGNVLSVRAQNSTFLNTNVSTLIANITGAGQNLTVNEANSLTAIGQNVVSNGGDISINLVSGSLNGTGSILAGTGNVTLNASLGNIALNTSAGQVSGNVLSVRANGSTFLNTNVASLVANITGAGQTLTVNEATSLNITAGTDVIANSAITLVVGTAGPGDLDISGNITSLAPANVTLVANGAITGTGNVTASNLFWTANSTPNDANWTYTGIGANVTGNGQGLTINRVIGGSIVIYGLTTRSGPISVTPNLTSPVNVDVRGDVWAGVNQSGYNDVVFTLNGAVNSNGGSIIGKLLNLTVANTSTVFTNVSALAANVTGTSQVLTIGQARNLTIDAAGLVNPAGDVNLTVSGDINGAGAINAVNLDVTADGGNVSTWITTLTGGVSNGAGGPGLNVTQASGDLTIGAAGLTSAGDPLTINVLSGNLTGTGIINAPAANVLLNTSAGYVALNQSTGQIKASLLTVLAQNASNLKTNVASFAATINATGATLTVSEEDSLAIAAGNVQTNGGDVSITAGDSINGTGVVNAGTGNVTLSGLQNIALDQVAGQVRGTKLDATSSSAGSVRINTTIAQLTALAAGGSVVVNETDDLTVVANGITAASGNISVVAGGNITIADNITGDNAAIVLLSSTTGNVSTAGGAEVFGNRLDVRANTTSVLNTSVNFLAANITGTGDLTVVNTYDSNQVTGANLAIHGNNVVLNGGNLTLTLDPATNASLLGSGSINAGGGNVTLNVTNGAITLNQAAGQVSGNVLTVRANGSTFLN
ncbi:MAG: S-layer family protein, partial [Planctomycetia bacterium]|nr:S-layer family protein [Planctomycetia bacterium]